jgi:hypothetical protein
MSLQVDKNIIESSSFPILILVFIIFIQELYLNYSILLLIVTYNLNSTH